MRRFPRLGALGVATVAAALAQSVVRPPDIDSKSAGITSVANDTEIIERTRRIALAYTDNLPNFICTQVSRSFSDPSADGSAWEQYREVVAEVRYVGKQDSYRTLTVNGHPSNVEFKFVSPFIGAFGTALRQMFRPESKAEFERTVDAVIDGRGAYVFDVVLPKRHRGGGALWLGHDRSGARIREIHVGSRGQVAIEMETGHVLWIESSKALGIPPDYPVRQSGFRIAYGYVTIGDGTYLVPVRAWNATRTTRPSSFRDDIEWRDCRRFDVESELTFESK